MAPTARNKQQRSGSRTTLSSPNNRANVVDRPGDTESSRPNGHIKFDSDDEGEDGGVALPTKNPAPPAPASGAEQASDEGSDGEDGAPETVTMRSGKDAARRKEEEAKKAIEAQEGAARQKRKRREAVFKEQKEDAQKRRKVHSNKLAAASDDFTDEDGLVPNDDTSAAPKPAPTLLPESLLERISDRPSPPVGSNCAPGYRSEDVDSEVDSGHKDIGGDLSVPSKNRERNRKKRLAQKAKMEFKKGPVSVKVLREDKKIRKVLMPPADKKAVNMKNAWLSGRGQVKRRSIGGGLGAFRSAGRVSNSTERR